MSIDEFKVLFDEAQQSGERIKQLNFLWKIMRSPFTEYHYSLITDAATSDEFRKILWSRFDEHGNEAENLLLSKLENNEDIPFHADIIYQLGLIADKKGGENKDKILQYAKQFLNRSDDYTRGRTIIVLGWIGSNSDIPLLANRLLNDTNSECRAWSASSFMQMDLRLKRKDQSIDKSLVYPVLLQAIEKETDYSTLGVFITSLQEISGKNFRLSNTAVECVDIEKIDRAKKSAINFLMRQ
ncbi:HEAT repeat domain-containing protein [Paenibacillus sp. GCM10027626]|uniref:HEAT repeat domain-containing protein n=1 Tax=Paenibacillus sp. GCM10027626 TaxID=3273411 RepID=UPI00362A4D98